MQLSDLKTVEAKINIFGNTWSFREVIGLTMLNLFLLLQTGSEQWVPQTRILDIAQNLAYTSALEIGLQISKASEFNFTRIILKGLLSKYSPLVKCSKELCRKGRTTTAL